MFPAGNYSLPLIWDSCSQLQVFIKFTVTDRASDSPQVTIQCLGAAVVVAASSVPEWEEGYTGGNVGGLLEAMLHPVGGFGKFLTILLSLSVAGNITATFYSISLNLQIFIPALVIVPRYVFSIVATAM